MWQRLHVSKPSIICPCPVWPSLGAGRGIHFSFWHVLPPWGEGGSLSAAAGRYKRGSRNGVSFRNFPKRRGKPAWAISLLIHILRCLFLSFIFLPQVGEMEWNLAWESVAAVWSPAGFPHASISFSVPTFPLRHCLLDLPHYFYPGLNFFSVLDDDDAF